MAKYKVLKSVIHNAAHSLLSDINWVAGSYFHDHLYDAARAANAPTVEIDLLTGTLTPAAVLSAPVREALDREPQWFERLVASGGASMAQIRQASVRVAFDFARSPAAPAGPGERRLHYRCEAELLDDRGIVHRAAVPEYWRY